MTFCAACARHSFTAVTLFSIIMIMMYEKVIIHPSITVYNFHICTHDTDTDNNARQYIILQISKLLNHSRKLLQFPLHSRVMPAQYERTCLTKILI